MDVELKGTVAAIDEKAFEGKEGEHVEYQEVFIQTEREDGTMSVAKVNTKKDMVPHLQKTGTFIININEQGKKKLISFNP